MLSSVVAIIVVVFIITTSRSCARSIVAETSVLSFSISCFFRNLFASINPVGVYVDRCREMIDGGLESLSTYFAVQTANSCLLIEFHRYCFFMIAEEACEGRCKRLTLEAWLAMLDHLFGHEIAYPFRCGGLPRGLLTLALGRVSAGQENKQSRDACLTIVWSTRTIEALSSRSATDQ